MVKTNLKSRIMASLEEVMDPELYISIVDLGLIYAVVITGDAVTIKMTLTTLGCPLFESIESEIKAKLKKIKEINKVFVELVFDPPWSIDKMTEKAKAMMGI